MVTWKTKFAGVPSIGPQPMLRRLATWPKRRYCTVHTSRNISSRQLQPIVIVAGGVYCMNMRSTTVRCQFNNRFDNDTTTATYIPSDAYRRVGSNNIIVTTSLVSIGINNSTQWLHCTVQLSSSYMCVGGYTFKHASLNIAVKLFTIYTVSPKKLSRFVFVKTSSNLHQF